MKIKTAAIAAIAVSGLLVGVASTAAAQAPPGPPTSPTTTVAPVATPTTTAAPVAGTYDPTDEQVAVARDKATRAIYDHWNAFTWPEGVTFGTGTVACAETGVFVFPADETTDVNRLLFPCYGVIFYTTEAGEESNVVLTTDVIIFEDGYVTIRPTDILVVSEAWNTYAPVAGAVFDPAGETVGTIPVETAAPTTTIVG